MKSILKNIDLLLKNFVCAVVLAVSLYAIVHAPSDSDTKKWAYGTVGLILGRALAPDDRDTPPKPKRKTRIVH
jgi:hypothetical protein